MTGYVAHTTDGASKEYDNIDVIAYGDHGLKLKRETDEEVNSYDLAAFVPYANLARLEPMDETTIDSLNQVARGTAEPEP